MTTANKVPGKLGVIKFAIDVTSRRGTPIVEDKLNPTILSIGISITFASFPSPNVSDNISLIVSPGFTPLSNLKAYKTLFTVIFLKY